MVELIFIGEIDEERNENVEKLWKDLLKVKTTQLHQTQCIAAVAHSHIRAAHNNGPIYGRHFRSNFGNI